MGYGAITRFLGEGFQTDAIEGTLRRAQIARLRVQDLPNVQLVSSNYHQLNLLENAYDLIVFTGHWSTQVRIRKQGFPLKINSLKHGMLRKKRWYQMALSWPR